MARSSTRFRRGLAAQGSGPLDRLSVLVARHAGDGELTIPYRSEPFIARQP